MFSMSSRKESLAGKTLGVRLLLAMFAGFVTTAVAAGNVSGSTTAQQIPDVDTLVTSPPTEDELAGDSVYQFILHHATTPYSQTEGAVGSLTRWRGGRPESICPQTLGLDPGYNAYVTARIRVLATQVGAPVQPDPNCKSNVKVMFTSEPEALMSGVYKWASSSLGVKHPDQPQKLLLQSGEQAIQGWYFTAAGGQSILNKDPSLLGHLDLLPIWPRVIQTSIHGNGCCYAGLVSVIVIVNTTKVVGYTIGSIADYIGMITLSLIQTPNHCDPLPSILDLMSSTCGARDKPVGITAGDLAFLRALYYHNTGVGPTLSRDDIKINMLRQLTGHATAAL
jgi:hypothetical protein